MDGVFAGSRVGAGGSRNSEEEVQVSGTGGSRQRTMTGRPGGRAHRVPRIKAASRHDTEVTLTFNYRPLM